MKPVKLTLLIAVSLAALAVLAAGRLTVAGFQRLSAGYPHSVQVISQRVNLRSAKQGRIGKTNVYQTDDALPAVASWYEAQYQVAPIPGTGSRKPDECVLLTGTKRSVIGQTTAVTLCPLAHGTQVYFNQTLFLR